MFTWLNGIIAAAVIAGAGLFYWHYQHLKTEADKVPMLTEQLASEHKTALDLSAKLGQNEGARIAADDLLTSWQNTKGDILAVIRREAGRAAASVIPACAPSDNDRRLRNDAFGQLLGPRPNPGGGSVSPAAAPPN